MKNVTKKLKKPTSTSAKKKVSHTVKTAHPVEEKPSMICPNCKSTEFEAVQDLTGPVKGQNRCKNCRYVLVDE